MTARSDLEDLVALLDHPEIERAHLVGLSMGGVMVADSALTHPERVAALLPVAAAPSGFTGRPRAPAG